MEKRPLSLTIIAWFLIVTALFAIYSIFTMKSNPMVMAMISKSGSPLVLHQAIAVIGSIITAACAYGIFKAQPWSRVLYVGWSVVSLVITAFMMPVVSIMILSVLFLVVIAYFLFSLSANEYFAARGLALHREE